VWKTVSLILTVPLFILSIGLTVWMFHYLDGLMVMGPEMPGMGMQPTLLQ
jgi:cytochrome o ubiquinol oxidase operon protein cyoD